MPLATKQDVCWQGWAVTRFDGSGCIFVFCAKEEEAWQVALGWPAPDEIEWHKAQGSRCFRAAVFEVA